jgi:hypothetical protein
MVYVYKTMDSPNLTATLADQSAQSEQRPEWIRMDAAEKLFGISRSKLYELISDRKIKSFCLRERNKVKGIRLLSFDSICEFLEKEAQAQQQET